MDKRNKLTTTLGSVSTTGFYGHPTLIWHPFQVHGTDMLSMYGTGNGTELQDYLINFAYNLNPNGPTQPTWPQWKASSLELLTLLDGSTPITITEDNFRVAAMEGITALVLKYPI